MLYIQNSKIDAMPQDMTFKMNANEQLQTRFIFFKFIIYGNTRISNYYCYKTIK